jgi:hypothetical protein
MFHTSGSYRWQSQLTKYDDDADLMLPPILIHMLMLVMLIV